MLDFFSRAATAVTISISETALTVKPKERRGTRLISSIECSHLMIFRQLPEKYGPYPIEASSSGVRLGLERMLAILSDATNKNHISTKIL
jgi:hypothetical protein